MAVTTSWLDCGGDFGWWRSSGTVRRLVGRALPPHLLYARLKMAKIEGLAYYFSSIMGVFMILHLGEPSVASEPARANAFTS
jgi:hypothetical protein